MGLEEVDVGRCGPSAAAGVVSLRTPDSRQALGTILSIGMDSAGLTARGEGGGRGLGRPAGSRKK